MTQNSNDSSGYASPPCLAHELDLRDGSYSMIDPVQATDVARWRKAERVRLIEKRLSLPAGERKTVAESVANNLDQLVELDENTIVSLYWPFRGELDLRIWMQQVFERGARVALPVVEAKARPLIFREWTPESILIPGVWGIPVPADGDVLDPNVVISPLVGFDPACYRLGYGGGFFDRTLDAMVGRGLAPQVIGVGHSSAAIVTIYPQPHDISMSAIVTEQGTFHREHQLHY